MSVGSVLRTLIPKSLGIAVINLFPEGRLKFSLRALGYRLLGHIPYSALANSGDTVVQAGCWRTETMEEWADIVGPGGEVLIIEANPVNVDILELEAERRDLSNVTIVQSAVWNEQSEVTLQVKTASKANKVRESSTFSVSHPNDSYEEEEVVSARPIDQIINNAGVSSPDHIHVTVSGAEREAIAGMEQTLQQSGVRVFVRSILRRETDGEPVWDDVVADLKQLGLSTARGQPPRQNSEGGNIYATKL